MRRHQITNIFMILHIGNIWYAKHIWYLSNRLGPCPFSLSGAGATLWIKWIKIYIVLVYIFVTVSFFENVWCARIKLFPKKWTMLITYLIFRYLFTVLYLFFYIYISLIFFFSTKNYNIYLVSTIFLLCIFPKKNRGIKIG